MIDKNGYKKNDKMSKREKEFRSILPGSPTGINIVDCDLRYALQRWKRVIKESGKLRDTTETREFVKPSRVRRKIKLDAIHRQRKSLETEMSNNGKKK